ncbi:MAG: DUF7379 domain-containing protein [Acidimicrobiales bacterium]
MGEHPHTRPSGIVVGSDTGSLEVVSIAASADTDAPAGRSSTSRSTAWADPLVDAVLAADGRVEVVDRFEVGVAPPRRGAGRAQPTRLTVDVPAGAGPVLLLAQDDATGLWRWHRPSRGGQRFDVDLAPSTTSTRGLLGNLAGRVVRFVVLKLGDRIIAAGAERLAAAFEERYRRGGLRWFGPDDHLEARPEPADQLTAADVGRLNGLASLLFLHGALVQTHTGFARLGPDLLGRLHQAYGGRVFAYDHHTASRTPRENATDLVRIVGELGGRDVTVDIVAHDRGGLVARELVERPPAGSPLLVRSVTFVGTPNAGTPLCDVDRLEKLVDRVTNLMALVPDNPITGVIDAVLMVATSIASSAAAGLVGLTAMSPGGEYLKQLNAGRPPNDAVYRAVASDYEPKGDADVARRLRNLVTDRIFAGANDLLVATDSVYQRTDRRPLVPEELRLVFGPGDGVDHYGYWDGDALHDHFERWFGLAPRPRTRERRVDGTAVASGVMTVAATADDIQDFSVRALHGSLECARHHVLVGHFMGTPIDGAESFLDDRLGHRLRRRELLGQYPEQLGESLIVDTPRPLDGARRGYPPGAIVVGLDRPGELTREALTTTVTAAMLRRAGDELEQRLAESADERTSEPTQLRFSAVAIGTSGVGALQIGTSVAAMVDAVVAANEQLHRHVEPITGEAAWDHVRIAELEIVEHREDRAEILAHEVRRVRDVLQAVPGAHSRLAVAEVLDVAEGALPPLPPTDSAVAEWQRVIIRDPRREGPESANEAFEAGTTVLEFTPVGGRARADRLEVRVDKSTVDSLIEESIGSAAPGEQVGNTLYELLVPTALKNDMVRISNLQLIVDEHTADIPWEALTTRPGGERAPELAIRAGVLRQFRETEGARYQLRSPTGNDVLVIGNPPAGGGLPPLPGAQEETTAVASLLGERGYSVASLVWDANGAPLVNGFPDLRGSPGRVAIDALFSRGWRIVHIASHGHFDPDDSSRSGAVIDERVTITPNVVRQLPVVPELVFLNCCHLGRVTDTRLGQPDRNRLAASVSRELMRIGVRAVIAAGWAVDDDAAVSFARTLYDRLLAGELLGASVHAARKKVRDDHAGSMTWAAFQCYGDPGYALAPPRDRVASRPAVVSASEVVRHVGTIRAVAAKVGLPSFRDMTSQQGVLVEQLDHLGQELTTRGWESPVTLYELGTAYAELGRYAQAVGCFRRAWNDNRSSEAPVRLIEQLGNFEIRLAQRRFLAADRSMAAIDAIGDEALSVADLVDQAKKHLTLARRLGENGERLALLGSFHKKAATLARGRARKRHIAAACDHYRRAHEWKLANTSDGGRASIEPYYTLNWLQLASLAGAPVEDAIAEPLLAAIARNPRQPRVKVDETGAVAARQAAGAATKPASDDYWTRVVRADLELTRSLRRGQAAADAAQLVAHYGEALTSGRSSQRDRDSTVDHVRDLAELLDDGALRELAAGLSFGVTGAAPAPAAAGLTPSPDTGPVVRAKPPAPSTLASSTGTGRLTVDMLPVGHGDCLVVSYGQPAQRILIDGGPAPKYRDGLARYLENEPLTSRRFELFVVTHVDSDHIDGAVILLQDVARLGVDFNDVWFNGWRQLSTDRGALQGEFLGALLSGRQWNHRFAGDVVVVPAADPLGSIDLPGGATLTMVSPEPAGLDRLEQEWATAVAEAGFMPGDEQASLALLQRRKALHPKARGKALYGGDNSVANASSIAFLLEHDGRSCLFTGDAYADVLVRGLDRLRTQRGVDRLPIDVMKLPHHGSAANVSPELFRLVDCRRFLVSTNGDYFKHPDPETLQLLAREAGPCEVIFNHDNDVVRRWETVLEPELRDRLTPIYPKGREPARIEV